MEERSTMDSGHMRRLLFRIVNGGTWEEFVLDFPQFDTPEWREWGRSAVAEIEEIIAKGGIPVAPLESEAL